MRARWCLLPAVISFTACSGGASSSRAAPADGGTQGEGGVAPDGGAIGSTADGDSSAGADGASAGDAGGMPMAGATVAAGNGCAASLGIDAGFYTCSAQYFVSPTGSDSSSGTSMTDALKTIGAATRLALKGGDCVTVADGTYDETVLVSASGSADTCTGYVVFRAASPGGAKVVSTDPYNGFMVNANYGRRPGPRPGRESKAFPSARARGRTALQSLAVTLPLGACSGKVRARLFPPASLPASRFVWKRVHFSESAMARRLRGFPEAVTRA